MSRRTRVHVGRSSPLEKLENDSLQADSYAFRFLPLLLILFAGSGCSALIYEIVWYQLLQFVIGSTAISLGVLLATFMGGLCLGSIALPRISAIRRHHPLRVYAVIEMGIGICGILVLFGMPLVSRIYVAAVGHGLPAILLRADDLLGLSAATNDPDGRIAAGHCAVDQDNSAGSFLAGPLVRCEHRRSRVRLPVGRVLSAASLRHGDGHVCCRGDQCCCGVESVSVWRCEGLGLRRMTRRKGGL